MNIKVKMIQKPDIEEVTPQPVCKLELNDEVICIEEVTPQPVCKLELDDEVVCTYEGPKVDSTEDEVEIL